MAPSRCRSSRTFTTENRSGAASLTYCTIYSPSAAHSLAHLNKTFHVIGMLIFSEGGETRDREAPPLRPHPYTDADWLALHHRKNLACNVRGRNEKEQSESKQVSQSRHSFFRPRNQMRPLATWKWKPPKKAAEVVRRVPPKHPKPSNSNCSRHQCFKVSVESNVQHFLSKFVLGVR